MRILIIEDDQQLCGLLQETLSGEGYEVDVCHEGDDGLHWMQQRAHDLVLLDRMLPRLDGITLLRIAREQDIGTPVLMVTALGTVQDRVDGLDMGADDYLVKPFSTKELLARVRAMGRRPREWSGQSSLSFGDMAFDPGNNLLSCGGESVNLSRREADLLVFFFKSGGKTLPRHALHAYVWGPDAGVEDGNLDSYIHYLRRHIRQIESVCQIVTVRNIGYRMENGKEEDGVS